LLLLFFLFLQFLQQDLVFCQTIVQPLDPPLVDANLELGAGPLLRDRELFRASRGPLYEGSVGLGRAKRNFFRPQLLEGRLVGGQLVFQTHQLSLVAKHF